MKTSELQAGGEYHAHWSYSDKQVIVIDPSIWNSREVRGYIDMITTEDPPTPFDPNTGKKLGPVEVTKKVPSYVTRYEPGKGVSSKYDRTQSGVPCFVAQGWNKDQPWKPELVRPQDIKSTWDEHVEASYKAQTDKQKREAQQDALKSRFAKVQTKLKKAGFESHVDLVYHSEWDHGRRTGYTSGYSGSVTINLDTLEQLVEGFNG